MKCKLHSHENWNDSSKEQAAVLTRVQTEVDQNDEMKNKLLDSSEPIELSESSFNSQF